MKSVLQFTKTCLLGGFFVLMPMMIFYLLLSELLELVVVALATPIADLFPEGTFEYLDEPLVIAIVLLVVASFLLGLALRSKSLTRIGSWIERATLDKFLTYQAIKRFIRGFIGADRGTRFTCGLLQATDGSQELIYIVEDLGGGRLSVIVPTAPGGFSGRVRIVDEDHVTRLQISVGDASLVLAHWGFGMSEIIEPRRD